MEKSHFWFNKKFPSFSHPPDHSKNPNMWKEYLKFLQSNFSTFSISQQRKSYALAINSLLFAPSRFIEMSLLDIFIQLCYFEKQSGFSEKCVAYFQAMIEFNFSCPQEIVDVKSMLRYFEGFWESEVPRFGDEVGQGFFLWVIKRGELGGKNGWKRGRKCRSKGVKKWEINTMLPWIPRCRPLNFPRI